MNFSELVTAAIVKIGTQANLAYELDIKKEDGTPDEAGLSRRMTGQYGWKIDEVNKLLEITSTDIVFKREFSEKIKTLKEAMKIFLTEGDTFQ